MNGDRKTGQFPPKCIEIYKGHLSCQFPSCMSERKVRSRCVGSAQVSFLWTLVWSLAVSGCLCWSQGVVHDKRMDSFGAIAQFWVPLASREINELKATRIYQEGICSLERFKYLKWECFGCGCVKTFAGCKNGGYQWVHKIRIRWKGSGGVCQLKHLAFGSGLSCALGMPVPCQVPCWSWPCLADLTSWLALLTCLWSSLWPSQPCSAALAWHCGTVSLLRIRVLALCQFRLCVLGGLVRASVGFHVAWLREGCKTWALCPVYVALEHLRVQAEICCLVPAGLS